MLSALFFILVFYFLKISINNIILFFSFIYSQDSNLEVKKDELVIEVSGMVCAMCAFGIQEGLSELSFLNEKAYKDDGINIDLDLENKET